jgi:hypothetical protein
MITDVKYVDEKKCFLIVCDTCGNERWYYGSQCGYGTRKYCSRSCVNNGRKKPNHVKKRLSEMFKGKNNPFYGKNHSEKNKEIMRAAASTSWEKRKERKGKDFDAWYECFCEKQRGENNPFYGKSHTKEAKNKMSISKADLIASGNFSVNSMRGLKGWYFSVKMDQKFYYDSFYERLRMIMLDEDDNVLCWTKKHKIKIPYQILNCTKHFVPDFLITKKDSPKRIIEEIKGYEKFQIKEAKLISLKGFAENNNFLWNWITRSEFTKMCLDYFGKSYRNLLKEFKENKQ